MTPRQAERLDLLADPASVGHARSFVRQVLNDWGMVEIVDTVALLTSELATNAVLHARTDFSVQVTRDDEDVRVEVLDGSPVVPHARVGSPTGSTGRGVAMVARLSSDWGTTPSARLDGYAKGVWFTVPIGGTSDSAWSGNWLDGP